MVTCNPIQAKSICHTTDGETLDYDTLMVITLIEEDGEPKIVNFKDFSDPEKRSKLHAWIAKNLTAN
jgi:hypothetical protein